MSRFGASKYRNAVASAPAREEWYRSSLVLSGSTTNLQTSTFSSEVKANHRHIVTVNPSGDASWRTYTGESGSGRVGNAGDWDLSGLDEGQVVVGGSDGSISLYRITSGFEAVSSTPATGSPISSVSLHPTTPSVVAVSAKSVAIWNLSSLQPVIQLDAEEPKGFWSISWSPCGKRIAAIGKSGTAYIWEPRVSTSPALSRSLPIQPIKPARVAWVGDNVFVTAFSRTRNREYHLFSGKDLVTVFTQSVDTSTAPLIPIVDQERNIVYLAAKGDSTLRQVELGGATGSQETLHSSPYPLAAQGLALASPTTLPVMQAQIATVLVPVVDKDGEVLLPLAIKVPRRQLIDYHDELYPEIRGFKAEQSPGDWFAGQDRTPLSISLDPGRRSTWEKSLTSETTNNATSSADTVRTQEPVEKTLAPSEPLQPLQTKDETAEKATTVALANAEAAPTPAAVDDIDIPDPSRPPLEGDETFSSTDYKARIIGGHIGDALKIHKAAGKEGPMFVGLQGPQGCGKTTLCDGFVAFLKDKLNISAAVLSLDDLYHTNANLKAVAKKHPNNHLLSGRGPSGTHDVDLAVSVLEKVEKINQTKATVDLPIFDKSLCGGEGDRSTDTVKVTGPIDVFILEGWSMGFAPLTTQRLKERYDSNPTNKPYFANHSFESLDEINTYLVDVAKSIYPFFSTLVSVVPTSYEHVFSWRLQQEHGMKAKNGGKGMTDEQVRAFVERYMPGYELWREGMYDLPWSGLELRYGKGREVLGVKVAQGAAKPQDGPRDGGDVTRAESSEVSKPTEKAPTATKTAPTAPKATFNPGYSRKFLAGKSPLNATYDSVPSLSTLHPDSLVLKANAELAFFPVQGPGGRLGVHPLAKKGRMVTGGEGYLSAGAEIADFAIDPFPSQGATRVAVATEDGAIKVWTIGKDGVHGVGPDADQVLHGKGVDKIAHLAFHPTARDLLVVLTNDGSASLRMFDLSTGEEHIVKLDAKGGYTFAFEPSGSRVAIATKDSRIIVLDPRKSISVEGKSHDSPRSFQLVWVDADTLISVGFNRGSQRKINLYNVSTEITTRQSLLVDVSPSVLFPVYDPDTRVLYVWGKGERAISAYEISLDQSSEGIVKLPSFTAGEAQLGVAFLSKINVDVEKVQVAKALRLTSKSIEEVSFTIPRNKPEFFQDDIFIDTLNTAKPALTAAEWLSGADGELERVSLQPKGMTPLSQAPKIQTEAKKRFVPAQDVMSEEAKKKKEMDALFEKAKRDESSDEDDEPPRSGLDPPDDW